MLENGDPCSTNGQCLSDLCDPVDLLCACVDSVDCLIAQVCDTNEAPNACEPVDTCGNGAVEPGETCDDGGVVSGDGCSATCFIDSQGNGSDCSNGGDAACTSGVCDTTETPDRCEPADSCGNGLLEAGETCDEGNTISGDGCSGTCFVDNLPIGSDCTAGGNAACATGVCDATEMPATCEAADVCGNALLEGGEVCDDGNAEAGDGCDPQCLLELGAGPCTDGAQCGSGVCNTMAADPVCAVPIGCGNGILNADEACDDGNLVSGDGCGESCTLENGWRGGGGCAVRRDRERTGDGWLLGLFIAGVLCRRKVIAAA